MIDRTTPSENIFRFNHSIINDSSSAKGKPKDSVSPQTESSTCNSNKQPSRKRCSLTCLSSSDIPKKKLTFNLNSTTYGLCLLLQAAETIDKKEGSANNYTAEKMVACENPQCTEKVKLKPNKKGNTKKSRILCKKCMAAYSRNHFCEYCNQIYTPDDSSMNSLNQPFANIDWIQCGHCERWNHIICEEKHQLNNQKEINKDEAYLCSSCTVKQQQQQNKKKPNTSVGPNGDSLRRSRRVKKSIMKNNENTEFLYYYYNCGTAAETEG
jgi:hypothetical protein